MKEEEKGCHNCVHRYGRWREFWRCSRIGNYTEIEMKHGGRCANGVELRLWADRKTLMSRLSKLVFFKVVVK